MNRRSGIHGPAAREGTLSEGFAGLFGPILLSAAIGVQLTLTLMLFVKPPVRQTGMLSEWGAYAVAPERDVVLYLMGIVFTLGLAAALVWPHRTMGGSSESGVPLASLPGYAAFQIAIATAGIALYLDQFLEARTYPLRGLQIPRSYVVVFAAIGVVSIAAALGGRTHRRPRPGEARIPDLMDRSDSSGQLRLRVSGWDLIVPTIVMATIYVPSWRQVSGMVFLEEGHVHWDYFAMGPALAFRHGRALGADFLPNYGAGWPMFFSALSSWVPLSYGRMIQIGSIYVCMYLAGVYLLLRLLVRKPALAAAGTAGVMLTFFLWLHALFLWRAPNVTPLRWAFDVWCFIALVLYWKTGRRIWAFAAGGCVGLAVVFNINAGLELAAASAFYWLCTSRLPDDKSRRVVDFVAFGGAAAGLSVLGLSIAGRGQVFSGSFWAGWLDEPLSFLKLPLATSVTGGTLISFAVLFFAYLALVGYCLGRLSQKRASHFEVFNGFLAFYGLLVLVKFLRHSSDMTFPRLLTPAAILLTILAGRISVNAGSYLRRSWGETGRFKLLSKWLPYAAAGLLVVLLVFGPRSLADPILSYPNLISARVRGSRSDGVCLMLAPRDICGLPNQLEGTASEFRSISSRLRRLRLSGKTIGVLDETGSLFYLATDTAPFGSSSRIFLSAYTKQLVGQAKKTLQRRLPDYILTRMPLEVGSVNFDKWASFGVGPRPDSPYGDAWSELNEVVRQHYSLDSRVEPFELWRLAQAAPAPAERR